jgi:hypothetical protein
MDLIVPGSGHYGVVVDASVHHVIAGVGFDQRAFAKATEVHGRFESDIVVESTMYEKNAVPPSR